MRLYYEPLTVEHADLIYSYTLDDDVNLSGRLIARFSYKNTEQPVTSWVEMFQKVLQILYAEDKNVITKLAASK